METKNITREELLDRLADFMLDDMEPGVIEEMAREYRRDQFDQEYDDVALADYIADLDILDVDETFTPKHRDGEGRWRLMFDNTMAACELAEGREVRVEPHKDGVFITLVDNDGKRWTHKYTFPEHAYSTSGTERNEGEAVSADLDINDDHWR